MKTMRANTLMLLCIVCAVLSVRGSAQSPQEAKRPLAVVAGENIYEDTLLPLVQAQMLSLRQQEYDIKNRALENLINQKLLEAEAKKRGMDADKLLDQEMKPFLAEPTDAEIEAYYLAQKDRLNRPMDDIKPQLIQALKKAKVQYARQQYLKRLREKADVKILLSPERITVGHDPSRLRGAPDAPVTIVEFSDFQCPYCQRAQSTLKQVLAKYEGKVRLSFRDFPLRQIHPQAQRAAEAARCAGEQGRFWEYHDLLFASQGKLDDAGLAEGARTVGLDAKQFDACLTSGKFKTQVDQDQQDAMRVGVSGAPAFFINGVFLNGAQPASAFEKIIEMELAAPRQQGGAN